MKNKMYTYLTLFLTILLAACDSSKDDSNLMDNSKYSQYGEAFDGVPDPRDAVIYQVNLRAFSEAGTLGAVTARLDDIKALGANVIYLMPIHPNGIERSAGGLGSPYSVRDYKAVSPEYGSLQDLQKMVEEAHKRDMAVIMDWVANHTAWDNAWISEHPEYYLTDGQGEIVSPPGTGWLDVAQLDYDDQGLQDAMIDAMAFWVYHANIDGFRLDAADFVPEGFWTRAVGTIDQIKDQEMLMLAEGGEQRHFNSGFDYIFGFNFFGTLKEIQGGEPASKIQATHGAEYLNVYHADKRVVRYTSNHDVNLTDGTPMELFGGQQGALAKFVVAATMRSIPMIYNGQEIGHGQRLEFFSKTPIDWSQEDPGILEAYKKIIAFRKGSEAIQRGSYAGHSSDDVVAFTMKGDGETVLVLSNMRNQASPYLVPGQLQGTWQDALGQGEQNLGSQLDLPPNGYLVLKK